ncbi:MT-A70 family methyltransferase [Nocardioides convexus]|uniref:MT-A70 family methyltransferase n=1 Tax=Nocardioides convexus TaxID=2712224 RepID=UPI002418A0C3|nr:MT-A70 family methyltransferase [Nocardioides convexus]
MTPLLSPPAAPRPPTAGSTTPRKVRTILADCPWDILQRGNFGAARHYDLMTLDRIKGMGKALAPFIADDAHLWLWVTNGTLRQGYEVAEAWGFQVRSPLTWVKWRLGLGVYLRNSTEHLLFATRGKAPVQFKGQPTWFTGPLQEHSHKPEEQFAIIERVSPGHISNSSPGVDHRATRTGRSGATRSTPTSRLDGYPVPSDLPESGSEDV